AAEIGAAAERPPLPCWAEPSTPAPKHSASSPCFRAACPRSDSSYPTLDTALIREIGNTQHVPTPRPSQPLSDPALIPACSRTAIVPSSCRCSEPSAVNGLGSATPHRPLGGGFRLLSQTPSAPSPR